MVIMPGKNRATFLTQKTDFKLDRAHQQINLGLSYTPLLTWHHFLVAEKFNLVKQTVHKLQSGTS